MGLSLSNGEDYLKLIDDDDDEIDMVAWEGKSGWDLEVENGESIERYPPDKDTDSEADWRVNNDPDPDVGGLITTSSTSTTSTSTTTTTSSTTTTTIPTLESLSVSVTAKNETTVRGNNQTIITEVTDGTNPIEDALVNVSVKYVGPTEKKFSGLTNSSGIFSFSWRIGHAATPGIFIVNSTASKEGYSLGIGSTTFNVTES